MTKSRFNLQLTQMPIIFLVTGLTLLSFQIIAPVTQILFRSGLTKKKQLSCNDLFLNANKQFNDGNHKSAIASWKKCLEMSPGDVTVTKKLSEALRSHNDNKSAEALLKQSVTINLEKYGFMNYFHWSAVNNLISFLVEEKRFSEAIQTLEELEVKSKKEECGDFNLAPLYSRLADLYHRQLNLEKAIKANLKAIELLTKTVGNDDLSTLEAFYSLGGVYYSQNELLESEQIFSKVINSRGLAQNSPLMSDCLNALGLVRMRLGKYKDSEKLFEKAISVRTTLYGENSIEVARSRFNLANNFYLKKNFLNSKELALKALKVFQEKLGKNSSETSQVELLLSELSTK